MSIDPRFPIGKFEAAPETPAVMAEAIESLATLPASLRAAVAGLSDAQRETPYRDGGWTLRQVVHHLADSHMNGLTRVKLALTEEAPTIKPYDEKAWAALADVRLPLDVSLAIIDGLHARWVALARASTSTDLARVFVHPEHGRAITVGDQLQLYAWHGRHHVAHITTLRRREGW